MPPPPIYFGDAPGCFVTPDFSPIADSIIAANVHEPDRALALVDLSGPGSPPGELAQFILLTCEAILIRDARNLISLLWYAHLGDVRLIDKRRHGRLGMWRSILERLSGIEQKYVLEIWRENGTLFQSIAGQVDDNVKKIIYNFLQQQRSKARR